MKVFQASTVSFLLPLLLLFSTLEAEAGLWEVGCSATCRCDCLIEANFEGRNPIMPYPDIGSVDVDGKRWLWGHECLPRDNNKVLAQRLCVERFLAACAKIKKELGSLGGGFSVRAVCP